MVVKTFSSSNKEALDTEVNIYLREIGKDCLPKDISFLYSTNTIDRPGGGHDTNYSMVVVCNKHKS